LFVPPQWWSVGQEPAACCRGGRAQILRSCRRS
jgi:hypothetical protein